MYVHEGVMETTIDSCARGTAGPVATHHACRGCAKYVMYECRGSEL